MPGKFLLTIFFLLIVLFGGHTNCAAQAQADKHEQEKAQIDPLERYIWYDADKTAKIQIYKSADGKFYGKVVWLKVPEIDGHPKVDTHNPNKARRNDPIIGLLLLNGLRKTGDNVYDDGTIYDPKNGKTYSCKLTYKGDKLDLHGYIGFSFIGRSTTWTRAE